jgi:hypothetical protein
MPEKRGVMKPLLVPGSCVQPKNWLTIRGRSTNESVLEPVFTG